MVMVSIESGPFLAEAFGVVYRPPCIVLYTAIYVVICKVLYIAMYVRSAVFHLGSEFTFIFLIDRHHSVYGVGDSVDPIRLFPCRNVLLSRHLHTVIYMMLFMVAQCRL